MPRVPLPFLLFLSGLASGGALPVQSGVAGGVLGCDIFVAPVKTHLDGLTYLAEFTVAPACSAKTVFRVRKSSTMSVKRRGAAYQPIFPNGSTQFGNLYSWSISRRSSNVPPQQRWTLSSWEWQVYRPNVWNERLRTYGAWQPIRSAP